MAEVFVYIGALFYCLTIFGVFIVIGTVISIISVVNTIDIGYLGMGIAMVIGGIFLIPTVPRVLNKLMKWEYTVK